MMCTCIITELNNMMLDSIQLHKRARCSICSVRIYRANNIDEYACVNNKIHVNPTVTNAGDVK